MCTGVLIAMGKSPMFIYRRIDSYNMISLCNGMLMLTFTNHCGLNGPSTKSCGFYTTCRVFLLPSPHRHAGLSSPSSLPLTNATVFTGPPPCSSFLTLLPRTEPEASSGTRRLTLAITYRDPSGLPALCWTKPDVAVVCGPSPAEPPLPATSAPLLTVLQPPAFLFPLPAGQPSCKHGCQAACRPSRPSSPGPLCSHVRLGLAYAHQCCSLQGTLATIMEQG